MIVSTNRKINHGQPTEQWRNSERGLCQGTVRWVEQQAGTWKVSRAIGPQNLRSFINEQTLEKTAVCGKTNRGPLTNLSRV